MMIRTAGETVMDVFKPVVAGAHRVRRAAALMVVCSGAMVAGWIVPATAVADPADDPCTLAVSFFCRFVPVAPDLDEDIDLTRQQPAADPADPAAPPPDSRPPAEVCATGCT